MLLLLGYGWALFGRLHRRCCRLSRYAVRSL